MVSSSTNFATGLALRHLMSSDCGSGNAPETSTSRKLTLIHSNDKHRLAFAKAHANELSQADTMFGLYISHNIRKAQSKLIAFIRTALSRPSSAPRTPRQRQFIG